MPSHRPALVFVRRARVRPAGARRARVAAALTAAVLAVLLTGAWTWPVVDPNGSAKVIDPFAAPDHRFGAGHRGVDLAAEVGATVRSPADGTVVFADDVAGVPVVVVAHGEVRGPHELRSTLQPARTELALGTLVRRGQVIGVVDTWPGHCGAPEVRSTCLHWGVRRDLDYLDPAALLSGPVRLLPMGPPVARQAQTGDAHSDKDTGPGTAAGADAGADADTTTDTTAGTPPRSRASPVHATRDGSAGPGRGGHAPALLGAGAAVVAVSAPVLARRRVRPWTRADGSGAVDGS